MSIFVDDDDVEAPDVVIPIVVMNPVPPIPARIFLLVRGEGMLKECASSSVVVTAVDIVVKVDEEELLLLVVLVLVTGVRSSPPPSSSSSSPSP